MRAVVRAATGSGSLVSDFVQDVRLGFRLLGRGPFMSATIVLCIGLGVGAIGTVYAWMQTLVLRPLPGVIKPDQLVSVSARAQGTNMLLSYPAYQDLRERTRALTGVAAFGIRRFNAIGADASLDARHTPVWGVLVSANYFDALGIRPALGRWFLPDEEQVGASPVAVISSAYWQTNFGSRADVIGRVFRVNEREVTIVGVAPAAFQGTITGLAFDLWLPVTAHSALGDNDSLLSDRASGWLQVFGRHRSGAGIHKVRQDVSSVGRQLAETHPQDRHRELVAEEFDTGPARLLRPLLMVLLGISTILLAIVCSNLMSLLLLKMSDRSQEFEIRAALGAGRGRLTRQLITENGILALAGIIAAFAVMQMGRGLLDSLVPPSPLPINLDAPLDWNVTLLTVGIGVLSLVGFGVFPALRATRHTMRSRLAASAQSGRRAARLRGFLVSAQFALSIIAIVCCGLFLRRLDDLSRIDRGFAAPERALLATVDFQMAGYQGDSRRREVAERILAGIREQPGVFAAAAATFVPLGFGGYTNQQVQIDGYVPVPGESMAVMMNQVSDDYFRTMEIGVVKGRPIQPLDRADAMPVAVVNEAFAQRYLRTDDAVGKHIRLSGRDLTVVGVVRNGKYHYRDLDNASPPFVYTALQQGRSYSLVLHVRTQGDPYALVPTVRTVISSIDPKLALLNSTTLDAHTSVGLFPVRLGTTVLGTVGILALMLSALGLYAVMAHSVRQRRRELVIRMALGASGTRILMTVARDSWRYAALGIGVGLVLAAAAARVLASALPNIDAGDRIPFAAALTLLLAIAALSTVVPAWRASTSSSIIALKAD